MESKDVHWTQDDELIERFILKKLNPKERNELEDHLRICEVCKQEVRAQQMLVAGIRRSGREAFKARLREKVGLLPEQRIPWPHILSAAAVIVILLSVGIYNRWFETVKQPENTVVLIHPDAAPAVVSKDSVAEESAPPDDIRSGDQPLVSSERLLQKRAEDTKAQASKSLSQLADEDKSKMMEGVSSAQGAGAAATREESAQEVQADIVVAQPEILWAEGTILHSEELMEKGKAEQRGVSGYQFGKADAMRAAPSSAKKQMPKESPLLVIQQSVAAIPLSQQQLRQPNTVLTKVERLGEQIQITVYLDSLLDESDFARTTIEPTANDSVVVNLPNQRLRYKLPGDWKKQLLAKPAK